MPRRKATKKAARQKRKKKLGKKQIAVAKRQVAKKRPKKVGLAIGAATVKAVAAVAGEVTGSCVYYDQDGRRNCEDGVTKSYCDKQKNSTFTPHGRC